LRFTAGYSVLLEEREFGSTTFQYFAEF